HRIAMERDQQRRRCRGVVRRGNVQDVCPRDAAALDGLVGVADSMLGARRTAGTSTRIRRRDLGRLVVRRDGWSVRTAPGAAAAGCEQQADRPEYEESTEHRAIVARS